jgi:hypothetical protein
MCDSFWKGHDKQEKYTNQISTVVSEEDILKKFNNGSPSDVDVSPIELFEPYSGLLLPLFNHLLRLIHSYFSHSLLPAGLSFAALSVIQHLFNFFPRDRILVSHFLVLKHQDGEPFDWKLLTDFLFSLEEIVFFFRKSNASSNRNQGLSQYSTLVEGLWKESFVDIIRVLKGLIGVIRDVKMRKISSTMERADDEDGNFPSSLSDPSAIYDRMICSLDESDWKSNFVSSGSLSMFVSLFLSSTYSFAELKPLIIELFAEFVFERNYCFSFDDGVVFIPPDTVDMNVFHRVFEDCTGLVQKPEGLEQIMQEIKNPDKSVCVVLLFFHKIFQKIMTYCDGCPISLCTSNLKDYLFAFPDLYNSELLSNYVNVNPSFHFNFTRDQKKHFFYVTRNFVLKGILFWKNRDPNVVVAKEISTYVEKLLLFMYGLIGGYFSKIRPFLSRTSIRLCMCLLILPGVMNKEANKHNIHSLFLAVLKSLLKEHSIDSDFFVGLFFDIFPFACSCTVDSFVFPPAETFMEAFLSVFDFSSFSISSPLSFFPSSPSSSSFAIN